MVNSNFPTVAEPDIGEDVKIQELRKKLDEAKPVSQAYLNALFALQRAIEADIEETLSRQEAAVYVGMGGDGSSTLVLTPSAQKQNHFQLTRYNKTGAFGDSQYTSIRRAISENGLIHMIRLPLEKAEGRLTELMEAESLYQSQKSRSNLVPGCGMVDATASDISMQVQVSEDGGTVWVHSSDGSTVGRFSKKFGMDVHNTVTDQLQGASQCLHCTHEPAGAVEWREFCNLMKEKFVIEIPEDTIAF